MALVCGRTVRVFDELRERMFAYELFTVPIEFRLCFESDLSKRLLRYLVGTERRVAFELEPERIPSWMT